MAKMGPKFATKSYQGEAPQACMEKDTYVGMSECEDKADSLCDRLRRLRDTLMESRNNLGCTLSRIRMQPIKDACGENGPVADTLESLLYDCMQLSRQVHNHSCELSGIVGE